MPKPSPTSPIRPAAVSITIQNLRILVPLAAVAIVALAAAPGLLWAVTGRSTTPQQMPVPRQQETIPSWAVDIRPVALSALADAALGELPAPLSDQRRPPCDPDLERELRGACWVPVAVEKCPPGKAFVNDQGPHADGGCYARAMRSARSPTSGGPLPLGIAEP